jgi:hypothetical protein
MAKKNGCCIGLFLLGWITLQAQSTHTLQGKVLDGETGKPLAYASVGVQGKPVGTVANEGGEFEFHLPAAYAQDTLFVSMLGYTGFKQRIDQLSSNITVSLVSKPVVLGEVVVTPATLSGEEIVQQAVSRIRTHFSSKPYVMEGFFRQIQAVDGTYISVLEAAVNVHEPGYRSNAPEKVGIVEIRRSHYLNPKPYTNQPDAYYTQRHNSLLGTLRLNRVREIATSGKSPKGFYDGNYAYQLDSTLDQDGGQVYVISATPKTNKGYVKHPEKEYRSNTLFIDAETFAIRKVIFQYRPKGNYAPKEFKNVTATNDSILSVVTGHTHVYEFAEYEGVHYLKYMKWSDWVQDYNVSLQKASYLNEYKHELLFNRVVTDPSQFPPVKENIDASASLHVQVKEYNASFWKKYNVIKETPLEKQRIEELERKGALETQFEKEAKQSADDALMIKSKKKNKK